MRRIARLGRILGLVFLAVVWSVGHAQVLSLSTSNICEITFYGIKLVGAEVLAHKQDMRTLLLHYAQFKYHDCDYLLSAHPTKQTEVDWILQKKAKPLRMNDFHRSLPRGSVALVVRQPEQFTEIIRASRRVSSTPSPQLASPPVPPGRPPGGGSNGGGNRGDSQVGADTCSELGFCISSKGEASLEMACGPIKLKVSTEAKLEVGIKNDKGEISVSFP